MLTTITILNIKSVLFFGIGQRLEEGGSFFMYPILIFLLILIGLTIKGLLDKDEQQQNKTSKLLKSISLFALFWGFLGFMIGMIGAFDSIESFNGDIAPAVLAAGLKIGLLSPLFGIITFLVGRLGIIVLILKNK
ncbi:MotA/TolQ/ExbB proton channel family protein [Polaribacter pacificus]|nr:MotA/TolQ/ExbB proton channel family protein [Polaribacter pacificus]